MIDKFEKSIKFSPAFDKRDPDPNKNYGIHGVEIRFILKGPLGAMQFLLYTNWQLPHVTEELKNREYESIGGDAHWMERPVPADIGYHSPKPMYEGQDPMTGECPIIGGTCYYDGSGLDAREIYKVLLEKGSAGVWKELKRRYHETFKETE